VNTCAIDTIPLRRRGGFTLLKRRGGFLIGGILNENPRSILEKMGKKTQKKVKKSQKNEQKVKKSGKIEKKVKK